MNWMNRIGVVNIVLLLILTPVIAWMIAQEWRMSDERAERQRQYEADTQLSRELIQNATEHWKLADAEHELTIGLVQTLKEMSGNMALMLKREKAAIPQQSAASEPPKRIAFRPKRAPPLCQMYADAERKVPFGDTTLVYHDLVPNKCLAVN